MTGPTDTNGPKVASLRELPQSIEPAHDLWPGIESRLAALPPAAATAESARPVYRSAPRLRWLAAAAMVACLAVGIWIGRGLLPGGPAGGPPKFADRTSVPSLAPTAFDAAYVSDPRYERQRRALVRALQERLAALPPATRAKVSASLAAIEKAKKDLEQALGQDPSNALLQELLINTYQDEMRVLTDVHEASDSGRGI
ncbi:MAG: hypothetical protein ACTHL7_04780 [Steroidobacteraceae bacterium]